jgi:hypothetical protein
VRGSHTSIRTVVLDGDTFDRIAALANEWQNGTLR